MHWHSPIARDHPLVGRIWSVRDARFVDEATLDAAVVAAPWVLLGEKHDNIDHHVLEARLADVVAARRPRVALALEMLTADQQAAVDAALARGPDAVAEASHWEESGWPSFEHYRPVVAVATSRHLALVAANLPNATLMPLARSEPIADAVVAALAAATPPTDAAFVEPIAAEMRESHCGMLPERAVAGMVRVQWMRDAMMVDRMVAANHGDGVVLVAGTGHTRRDRGVPAHLARVGAPGEVVSVAFVEVAPGHETPESYGEAWGAAAPPFDYLWFTPVATNEDPCAELRAHGMSR